MPPIPPSNRQRSRRPPVPFPLLARRFGKIAGEATQEHRENAKGQAFSKTRHLGDDSGGVGRV